LSTYASSEGKRRRVRLDKPNRGTGKGQESANSLYFVNGECQKKSKKKKKRMFQQTPNAEGREKTVTSWLHGSKRETKKHSQS